MPENLVIIKGAGDLASGTAHRLVRSGFPVVMLEMPEPTVIRRTVSFAEAVFCGEITVEGITAVLAQNSGQVNKVLRSGQIPVLVDPAWRNIKGLRPTVVVDAIIAKENLGTGLRDAPVVIGLGPGFTAGVDVCAVVETQRGHNLGRVLFSGSAAPNTGVPGNIAGFTGERLLRSPGRGILSACKEIGDYAEKGETVAMVGTKPVVADISGIVRGMLKSGIVVSEGMKFGDIDPRGIPESCFTISDKARAVAGGVLEAVMYLLRVVPGSRDRKTDLMQKGGFDGWTRQF